MYKAIYNKYGEPIGIVSLGIYTKGLVRSIDPKGFHNASYSMINVADNKYVFVPDETLIATEATNKEILDITKKLRQSRQDEKGSFELKKNGKKYIAAYRYISEYGWLFIMESAL